MLEVSAEVIAGIPSLRAAQKAAFLYSGRPLKAIASDLGIAEDRLSRMLNDSPTPLHMSPELYLPYMDVCGNEVPLIWLNMKRGYPTPRSVEALLAELERVKRELADLRADNDRLVREAQHVVNVFKEVKV